MPQVISKRAALATANKAAQKERKVAYTQGVWLGLWAGVLGTNAAWIFVAIL